MDTNDGLTQGFFQEFHIFPGMETTTPHNAARPAQLEPDQEVQLCEE